MASRTQLRLAQITGSAVDIKSEAQQYATAHDTAVTGSDLNDILGMIGAALNRIHGAASDEPFNSAEGTFATSVFDVNSTGNITIDSSGGTIKIGADDINQNITIGEDGTRTIQIGAGDNTTTTTINSRGGTLTLDGTGQAVNVESANFDIDASGTVKIDGVGTSNLTTNGALTISGSTGLNLQSHSGEIDITSTQGAIDINATGAGIDIDAGAASAFNTSAGKITIAGAAGEDIGTSGQTTTLKGELNVDEAATFDNNVTITGNLDVNGTTTTVDTVNLSIEDSIIALGVSGANGGYSQTGDRGILFPRGVVGSATNGFWFDGSQFNLGQSKTGPTSGSFASVDSYSDLHLGDATLKNNGAVLTLGTANTFVLTHANSNDTATVSANDRLAFGDAGDYIVGDGDDISVVGSRDIILDAASSIQLSFDGGPLTSIKISEGSTQVGHISGTLSGDGKGLIISSSNNGSIILDSNNGFFSFAKAGLGTDFFQIIDDGGGNVKLGGGDEKDLLFVHDTLDANPAETFRIDSSLNGLAFPANNASGDNTDGNGIRIGLLTFNGTTDQNEAIYGDGNRLYIRSNGVNFKFPTAEGSANQVLTTDGASSPTLSFSDISSLVGADKGIKIITASHAAGGGDAITGMTQAESQGASLDVFVNGQLLVSGSSTERTNGTRDYEIQANGSAIKFAFALEIDDVVQVIKR
jgi:hypothetical protein